MTTDPLPVLHVEDDENDVYLLGHVLRSVAPGSPLFVVRDGDEAEAYLAGRPPYGDRLRYPLPALILMDLKLPKKTGLEVLDWMKSQPALERIPVYILSSSSEKSDIDQARRLGVTDYLIKPASLKDLSGLLSAVVAETRRKRA